MKTLIDNVLIVNEGFITEGSVIIKNDRFHKIGSALKSEGCDLIIDGNGCCLFPGFIDDQVHFREPGLTHKADIYTESRAAAAGGITSFMEMPNTVPNTVTQELLQEKYNLASKNSLVNYSFYMGATNNNLEEVLKTDPSKVCGVKIFMGSSTGNMLVDQDETLEQIFAKCPMLIATHCEDEETVRRNTLEYQKKYGKNIPIEAHPLIRSREACYLSSSKAVELAKKHGTRLHVLHISTAEECALFSSGRIEDKKITAEACIHHLWFSDEDYKTKGTLIKWNPAVKTPQDRDAIMKAVLSDRIDVIATDHAPHTLAEKQNLYEKAPSGGPLVQHALLALMDLVKQGSITIERVVEKFAHNPAKLFNISDRGFIREGYYADFVLINPHKGYTVKKSNILSKCGWSPFESHQFSSTITHTFVNGKLVYKNGTIIENKCSKRLLFNR